MYDYHRLDKTTALAYLPLTDPALRPLLAELDLTSTGATSYPVAMGAMFWGEPAGIALARFDETTQEAELLEIFITPECRRAGMGMALLSALEGALLELGAKSITTVYQTDEHSPGLERLLEKQGWSAPSLKHYLFWGAMRTGSTPWVDESRLPAGFEAFPWTELTAADRQAIEARQEPYLSPFSVPEEEMSPNSIGLRHQGDVVGWVITRPQGEDGLLYEVLYVIPELQSAGLGLRLLAEAIQRHQAQNERNESIGLWRVRPDNKRMLGLVEHWLGPWLTHQAEERAASKQLA